MPPFLWVILPMSTTLGVHMWRVNYLLKCFFTLMLNVVKELCRFWFCVESTLPDCIRYDHYKDYQPENDPQDDPWEYYDTANDPYLLQRGHDDSENIENDTGTRF